MTEEKMARISELSRKQRSVGLTDEEKAEIRKNNELTADEVSPGQKLLLIKPAAAEILA